VFGATKALRNKETRRLFYYSVDHFYYSPLPPGEGLGVGFFLRHKHKDTKKHEGFFISELTTSPFGGLRGLSSPFGRLRGLIKRAHGINPQALLFCISVSDFRLTF